MTVFLLAAGVPAVACGGCAWACNAPPWAVMILTICGALSGLTGGAIVSNEYERRYGGP
jgi:hypothetical protein